MDNVVEHPSLRSVENTSDAWLWNMRMDSRVLGRLRRESKSAARIALEIKCPAAAVRAELAQLVQIDLAMKTKTGYALGNAFHGDPSAAAFAHRIMKRPNPPTLSFAGFMHTALAGPIPIAGSNFIGAVAFCGMVLPSARITPESTDRECKKCTMAPKRIALHFAAASTRASQPRDVSART